MTDHDADGSSRRQFLARAGGGLAAAVATAGCLDSGWNPLGEEDGMRVRARTAAGTKTDTRCRLSDDFVAAHPVLERVLAEAAERSGDGWASRQVTVEQGESLGDALHDHCEGETRGLYRYRGEWYFVSLQYEDPDDHGHPENGTGGSHEHSEDGGGGTHGHERFGRGGPFEARTTATPRTGVTPGPLRWGTATPRWRT